MKICEEINFKQENNSMFQCFGLVSTSDKPHGIKKEIISIIENIVNAFLHKTFICCFFHIKCYAICDV